jgi:hypothetical protein
MRLLFFASAFAVVTLAACKGEDTSSQPFCADETCIEEPMLVESTAPGKPFVRISFKNCQIDSIHWEKSGGVANDIIFNEFIEKTVKPSKQFLTCDIIEGKYAWVKFNDCATGRGYLLKLGFDKDGVTSKFTSAINNFDPKFAIEDGLVAYYDNTFIYVEDMQTGQIAKQLLTDTGVTEIDYDNIHSLIDSVNITKTNIYAKLKVKNQEIVHNNPLNFK